MKKIIKKNKKRFLLFNNPCNRSCVAKIIKFPFAEKKVFGEHGNAMAATTQVCPQCQNKNKSNQSITFQFYFLKYAD